MRTIVVAILTSAFVWSLLIASWMFTTRKGGAVMTAEEAKRIALGDGVLFWRIVFRRLPRTPGGRFLVLALLLAALAILASSFWPK